MMMTFSGGIASFLWSLVMIFAMSLPIIILFWVFMAFGERLLQKRVTPLTPTPLEDLKTRLAKGEISVEDFQRLRGQITQVL